MTTTETNNDGVVVAGVAAIEELAKDATQIEKGDIAASVIVTAVTKDDATPTVALETDTGGNDNMEEQNPVTQGDSLAVNSEKVNEEEKNVVTDGAITDANGNGDIPVAAAAAADIELTANFPQKV
jgi:hypothetical protein